MVDEGAAHVNAGALRQLMAWNNGVLTTPTFNIDGTIIADFDEAKLKEILDGRL